MRWSASFPGTAGQQLTFRVGDHGRVEVLDAAPFVRQRLTMIWLQDQPPVFGDAHALGMWAAPTQLLLNVGLDRTLACDVSARRARQRVPGNAALARRAAIG